MHRGVGRAIDADWPDTFVYFAHQPGNAKAKAQKNPTSPPLVSHHGSIGQP